MNTNKFYVIRYLTNDKGQDGSGVSVFTGETEEEAERKAIVNFHNTCATYHNSTDVLFALVKVEDYQGGLRKGEIIDHRPKPESEPEPEQTTETEG